MKSFMHIIQSYGRLTGSPPVKATPLHNYFSDFHNQQGANATNGFIGGSLLNPRCETTKRLEGALKSIYSSIDRAAVIVRSLIRESRRTCGMSIELLSVLYDLAAIESFLNAYPFDIVAKLPSRNVHEFIQQEQWQRILHYEYETLGYDQLELLNKTDCSWLKEAWGEPSEHTTLRALHKTEWREAVQRLLKKEWERYIEIPSNLTDEELELCYSKPLSISFEEYLDMKHKSWERFVAKNNNELGCLDMSDTRRKNWERFNNALEKITE